MSEDEDDQGRLIVELLNAGVSYDDALAWIHSDSSREILEFVSLFERSPHDRYLMRLARRANITYSEATVKWQNLADLFAEIGLDILESRESLAKCPECGMDHDLIRSSKGRPLPGAPYKLGLVDCWVNREIEHANSQRISEEDRKSGVRFTLMSADPGENWIDHSTDLERAAKAEEVDRPD